MAGRARGRWPRRRARNVRPSTSRDRGMSRAPSLCCPIARGRGAIGTLGGRGRCEGRRRRRRGPGWVSDVGRGWSGGDVRSSTRPGLRSGIADAIA